MKFCIELTNHCNFRCVSCPHSLYGCQETPSGNVFDRPKGFMAPTLFRKTVAEARTWASDYAIGFFGEQLLHPQFNELVREIPARAQRSFHLTLNSNWSLVTEQHLEALDRFDCIRISLDSPTKEGWETLCPGGVVLDKHGGAGPDRYETLVEKIEWYLAVPNRPRVHLICVLQEANKHDAKALVAKWLPKLQRWDKIVTKSILSFGGIMRDGYMRDNPCRVAREKRFVVAWDGRCSPCSLDVNLAMAAGDLRSQSVQEIVEGRRWRRALGNITQRRGICSNCFDAQNHGARSYRGKHGISN